MQETIFFYSKNFFGEATDATLRFYQQDRLVYTTNFQDGYTAIKMPSQLEPGVYDVVAERETSEYRVNNLMIALASHYFSHSRLHDDLSIEGENLKPGEIIEEWKVNPIVHNNLSYLPTNAKKVFDDMSQYANPDGMRWGGQVRLSKNVEISRGAAFINGDLIEWDNLEIPIPDTLGTHNLGIKNKQIIVTKNNVDYKVANIIKEHEDWVRLDIFSKYHPIQHNDYYVFSDFEKESKDITINMPSEEALFGNVYNGKSFGTSRSTIKTNRVKVKKIKNGPVFSTDRLYVYATDDYFLLWEDRTLLTALPRWSNSYVMLNWGLDGLVFVSWGDDGQNRWSNQIPYDESYVKFNTGTVPISTEENLKKVIEKFGEIPVDEFLDWNFSKSTTATMKWAGTPVNKNILTYNQSTVESGTVGLVTYNASISNSTSYVKHGTSSLAVTVLLANETKDCYVEIITSLEPGTVYSWQASVYCPAPSYINLGNCYLQERGGGYKNIALAGIPTVLPVGWNVISGSGTTHNNWNTSSRLVLRPPRKNNGSSFDSNKIIYYDKIKIEKSPSPGLWTPGEG